MFVLNRMYKELINPEQIEFRVGQFEQILEDAGITDVDITIQYM